MTPVSSSAAAFHQFFRDRETGAAAQKADGSDASRKVATDPASGPSDPARSDAGSGASGALTPSQVRDRLNALITTQVEAGKLTDGQAAALRQSLGPDKARDDAGTGAPPPPPVAGRSPLDQAPASDASASTSPTDVLATFIQNIQRSDVRNAGYGSTGGASTRALSSRLLDFNT